MGIKDNKFVDKYIVILSEDEKSFTYYFEKFMELKKAQKQSKPNEIKQKFGDRKFKYQQHFIKVIPDKKLSLKITLLAPVNHNPQGIIDYSKQLIKENNNKITKIFCAFDYVSKKEKKNYESYQNILSLRSELRNKGIEITESVPCYEFWLLAHFLYSSGQYTDPLKVKKSLEIEYKKEFKKELKYEKNDKEFLKNFTEKMIKTATKNTQKLEEYHDKHDYKERNPSSKIYKIIEFFDEYTKPKIY